MSTHTAHKYQKLRDSAENVLYIPLALSLVCNGGNPPSGKFLPMPAFMAGAHTISGICLPQPRERDKVLFRSSFFPYSQLLFPIEIMASGKVCWHKLHKR